jgi:hypothetical protein
VITSEPAKGRVRTDHQLLWYRSLPQVLGADPGAPAAMAALEDVAMVEEAASMAATSAASLRDLAPVLDGAVRGEERAGAFVPAHHHLEKVLGGSGRKLPHASVVDDEQRDAGQLGDGLLAGAVEGLITSMAAFRGPCPHRPGPRTAIPAPFR